MAHPVNIILLVLGIFQGFLLGLYLLRKQKTDQAGVYFISILVIVGLQLTFKTLSKIWLMQNVHVAYTMSYNLPFLAGPALFLYVSARTGRRFSISDLFHALPFLTFAGLDALHFYSPNQIHGVHIHPYFAACLRVTSIVVYSGLAWRLVNKNLLDVLRPFILVVAISEIIISITLAVMYMHHPAFPDVRWLFVTLTVLVYWISYHVMESPAWLQRMTIKSTEVLQKNAKYDRSGLKEKDAERISNALTEIMVLRHGYLDSGLTIESLARQLNTSRHHLSQVINGRFGQSYHEYINEFRLAEAYSRLESGLYSHFTVSAIALDCGFSSVSNFNELFRKRFNMTPSQVRQVAEKINA